MRVLIAAAALAVTLSPAVARAAAIHEFNAPLTEALEGGVPSTATPAEALLKGPLSGVNAVAADSGHVWVAEKIESGSSLGKSRVDEFDAKTGAFMPAQLEEEDGVNELGHGVAVGRASGEAQIYVGAAHEGKGAVAVYGPTHKLQPGGIWGGQNTPSKGLGEVRGVAVSSYLETEGDVFVATSGPEVSERVIDIYAGEAGGKEPALLGQLTGTPSGLFNDPHGIAVSPVSGDLLVADGDSDTCKKGEGECVIDVFEPAPGLPGTYTFVRNIEGPQGPFVEFGPLAVDGAGDIYIADQTGNVVDQLSASGELLGVLSGTPGRRFTKLRSIAADAVTGDLFIGDFEPTRKTGTVDAFGPTVVVPDVETGPASEIKVSEDGAIEARLNGSVNPVGEGAATCGFAWGPSATFGQFATCEPEAVPNESVKVPVHAQATGLSPDTSYSVRLQASNHNGTNLGRNTVSFSTPGPGIHGVWASDVASASASLNARIDPNEAQTSYYFQYGTSAAYGAESPGVPGAPVGAGKGDVLVAPRHIQSLTPGTTYHYRVVAVSTVQVNGKPVAVSFPGADQTFTTQAGAGAGGLPDGRRWELVSPPDKHGALLEPLSEAGVIQASASGSSIAYLANLPTEATVKGYIYYGVQVLAARAPSGWSSTDISLPHASLVSLPLGAGTEYRAFSEDLCTALSEPIGPFTSLAPEAFPPDSERTPYLRHDCSCPATPSTCFEPLVTGAPGYANVPEGTRFGGNPEESGAPHFFGEARFRGATGDLSHAILSSKVQLTPVATGGKEEELYEFSAEKPPTERLSIVSLLPANGKGEELPGTNVRLGFEGKSVRGALSANGGRVVWSGKEGEGAEDAEHLYLRDIAKGQTVQLDRCTAGEECEEGSGAPTFQLAASDGARVLFTDTQPLTSSAGRTPGKADLYECEIEEVAGKLTCALRDLTPAPGPRQTADVQRTVIGASSDASRVYFVANGALAAGASEGDCRIVERAIGEGECTLYVEQGASTRAIARLSGKDYPDWAGNGGTLNGLTARVSADGRWLAFMSQQPLTGYDNRDAVSGEPDEEVYLYDGEGAGSLSCASCNPSGARPEGVEYAKLTGGLAGGDRVWPVETWIAANVPGWTPYEDGHATYQSRYLSDEGRVFFNTNDALVAKDINHNQDVYEYEPPGVGDCTGASLSFSTTANGCVSLISSGTAAGESGFLDASENGNDVFFLTPERLVPAKDIDTSLDLYDAHVCSSDAPCAEEPAQPPACATAESCRAAPAPQPAIFGAPSSATFSGPGNPTPPPPPPPVKHRTAAQERAEKLAKALKVCRRKHNRHKRAQCEKAAHRARKATRKGKR